MTDLQASVSTTAMNFNENTKVTNLLKKLTLSPAVMGMIYI